MMPHPDHIRDWLNQLNEAGARFCAEQDPMDAILVALLARNIERAAGEYLTKFNLKGLIDGSNQ